MIGKKLGLLWVVLLAASCIQPLPPVATEVVLATVTPVQEEVTIAWQGRAAMPTPRSELAAAVHEGNIYVPGGWTNDFGQATTFERYNPQSDQWAKLADLPLHLNHHVTVALQATIYVIGIEGAFQYDIAADQWSPLPPPPDLRWAGAAVGLDDALYLVGGDSLNQDLLRYHPTEARWESLAPLPEPREHLAAAVLAGQIYAIGGRWGEVATTRVERYDPASNQWSPVAPLQEARSGFSATVVDGRIVVAGGETLGPLRALRSVEVYEPTLDQWTLLTTTLPFGVHGHSLVTVGATIYLVGGSTQPGSVANSGKTLAGVLE